MFFLFYFRFYKYRILILLVFLNGLSLHYFILSKSVQMAIGDGLSFCVNISIRLMLSRYMLFLQNFSYQPKDALSLKIKARAIASQNEMIIRDTRVSKSYIEYDISIPDKHEVREVANIFREIGAYASSYHVVERKREKKEGVTEAITFFNEEKYWIAHEIFESIWKGSRGVEKELLGGTILVCAAFVHFQKDEGEICISILSRALNKLKNVNGLYFQMDVDKLRHNVYNNIQNGKPEPFHI